jgi:ribosomal protein S18 acetylase RimI-like enzyme
MNLKPLNDKVIIERFLRKDPFLHLYSIGDLDDFFWPSTQWLAIVDKEKILSILLIYRDIQYSVLLALNRSKMIFDQLVFEQLTQRLPVGFYAHLTEDFKKALNFFFHIKTNGIHVKMGLLNSEKVKQIKTSGVISLTAKDLKEIEELFKISYPSNWFSSRMLDTGQYFGFRINGRLVCSAGVHVYSPTYRVAALGNITTHPEFRGQGLATRVTAHLCKSLDRYVDHIGLNVKKDNIPAVRCYENLGFQITGGYEECYLKAIE